MAMTTLLESRARPFGSSKGMALSMALHGAIIAAAVFGTARVVLPPREKVEEHPVLYVASPPPPPVVAPEPLPVVKTPPKPKALFKAPPPKRFVAPRPPQPRPVAQVPPKGPTTPALVAPTKMALSLPAVDLKAVPTISDVVAPPVADVPMKSSGIPTGGSVRKPGDDEGEGSSRSKGGLGSGSAGRAYDENQVDRPAQGGPKPHFPDALRSVNVQGVVAMRFIVGADGRVEPGSIEVIESPHKLFSDAVRSALLGARYRPAEAGGHAVRQLVEQAFSFKLDK
jgi:protein TonB